MMSFITLVNYKVVHTFLVTLYRERMSISTTSDTIPMEVLLTLTCLMGSYNSTGFGL